MSSVHAPGAATNLRPAQPPTCAPPHLVTSRWNPLSWAMEAAAIIAIAILDYADFALIVALLRESPFQVLSPPTGSAGLLL